MKKISLVGYTKKDWNLYWDELWSEIVQGKLILVKQLYAPEILNIPYEDKGSVKVKKKDFVRVCITIEELKDNVR